MHLNEIKFLKQRKGKFAHVIWARLTQTLETHVV